MKRQKKYAEIRLDHLKELDEVVSNNVSVFHLERMDRNAWWMRIDLKDGRAIVVNLSTHRATIDGLAEWD